MNLLNRVKVDKLTAILAEKFKATKQGDNLPGDLSISGSYRDQEGEYLLYVFHSNGYIFSYHVYMDGKVKRSSKVKIK